MATYAIGDLQGCHEPLLRLLDRLAFDRSRDRLLFTGDLVNRGPASLECLRLVKSLGAAAITVLGNHDLHLLAAAHSGTLSPADSFGDVLGAHDREGLLAWLRRQPLAYEEPGTGFLMVHAGVVPQWNRAQTLELARETSDYLNSADGATFLERMYGNQPDLWSESLAGVERIRFVVNCLTRLRYCDAAGRMNLKPKGQPGTQPAGLMPWFQVPGRRTAQDRILCGHWSTLGQVAWQEENVWGLDTGCVWGGCLTALNLETGELVREDCGQYRKPGVSGD